MKTKKHFLAVHDGVWKMSSELPGLVETSMNHGLVDVTKDGVSISGAARGSVESTLQPQETSIRDTAKKCGFGFAVSRSCAPWPADTSNPLIGIFSNAWKKVTGNEMTVVATHAGLECGWFSQKAPRIQIVSVGPTLENPHTVNETTYASSVSNNIQMLSEVLATLNEPTVQLGVVAQRYPWNGIIDIQYRTPYANHFATVTFYANGEMIGKAKGTYNQSATVSFDLNEVAGGAFKGKQLNGVKITATISR